MMKLIRTAMIAAAVIAIGAISFTALAATGAATPAQILASLTGKPVDSVIAEKQQSGKTYGTLARDAGKLEEFKDRVIESKKAILDERVAAGTMTREQADAILKTMEERMENCDGTCAGGTGNGLKAGFGRMGGGAGGMGAGRGGAGYGMGTCAGCAGTAD